jgi:sugar lactone lactonase YvrE
MSVNRDGEVELALKVQCALGESPVWDARTNELVWVDIRGERVYWWVPGSPSIRELHIGHTVSAVAPRRLGGYVIAVRSGFGVLDGEGTFELIAGVETDLLQNRMNDGKCDPAGRFWAGTMSETDDPGAGSLYRLNLDQSVTKVVSGVTVSNGLGWSPDATVMYYVDSLAHGLDAFDFSVDSGEATTRRRIAEIPEELGLPDGIAVDDQGYIWVALYSGGALHRYSPEGELESRIEVPVALVTSCAFGGPDYHDLYITTAVDPERDEPLAGSIFRYRAPVGGRAAAFFES